MNGIIVIEIRILFSSFIFIAIASISFGYLLYYLYFFHVGYCLLFRLDKR